MSSPASSRERNVPLGGPASIVDTACPLDCPDGCSLSVTVQHGRVVTIDGSERNPVTAGFVCERIAKFGDRVYGSDRLLHPGIRKGRKGDGKFERASWEEALGLIVERMEQAKTEWGAEAILPYSHGGSNGLMSQDALDATVWRRYGTSRLTRGVSDAPTSVAQMALYGTMASTTYQDYPHARLIVLWGVNPSVSSVHLVPYIREAQKNGATLVVIDPRATPLARSADVHLAVRPGTDVAVALAIHRYLFVNGHADDVFLQTHTRNVEKLRARAEAWTIDAAALMAEVDPKTLERVAQLYAESSPALICCGLGLEQNRNGGNAAMAILALPAVGGKFGIRGGGYSTSNSASWNITPSWIGAEEPATRTINRHQLGRALLEEQGPPVKVLFVYNSNPAATAPDQQRVLAALERDDLFTVAFDQVMTDTALYADVILPATTFLESYDFAMARGPINLDLVRPVIDAVGEARSNADVFGELCVRLDLHREDDPTGELDLLVKVLDAMPASLAVPLRHGALPEPAFGLTPVQFVDVFPGTTDGKVDLFPETLEAEAPAGLYEYQADPGTGRYPLALISPASELTINSTLGELSRAGVTLVMNPLDAEARGLADNDLVRIFNELGEVHCTVSVLSTIRPGTVSLPRGTWRRNMRNGVTGMALVPDTLTDLGSGACFNDARVQVASLPVA
jgi:anaerobic selenocysteine-containing dehydrogenase